MIWQKKNDFVVQDCNHWRENYRLPICLNSYYQLYSFHFFQRISIETNYWFNMWLFYAGNKSYWFSTWFHSFIATIKEERFLLASNNESSTNWNMVKSCSSKDFCDYSRIQSKAILFKIHRNDKYSFFYLKLNGAMHFSNIINISANGNGKCVIRKNELILKFSTVHLPLYSLPWRHCSIETFLNLKSFWNWNLCSICLK